MRVAIPDWTLLVTTTDGKFAAIQSISTEPKKTRDYDEMKLYSSSYFS